MARTVSTLLIAAVLSAWASAHTAVVRPVAEELRLLNSNRELLEHLITHGLSLSEANSPLDRADKCQKAATTLADALSLACRDPNPDVSRIAELSDYLGTVLTDGLTPTLREARSQIAPGSPEFARLEKLEQQSDTVVRQVIDTIPTTGPLGERVEVRTARGKLLGAGK